MGFPLNIFCVSRLKQSELGASLVETGIILPVLLVLVMGWADVTKLLEFKMKAEQGAMNAAIHSEQIYNRNLGASAGQSAASLVSLTTKASARTTTQIVAQRVEDNANNSYTTSDIALQVFDAYEGAMKRSQGTKNNMSYGDVPDSATPTWEAAFSVDGLNREGEGRIGVSMTLKYGPLLRFLAPKVTLKGIIDAR